MKKTTFLIYFLFSSLWLTAQPMVNTFETLINTDTHDIPVGAIENADKSYYVFSLRRLSHGKTPSQVVALHISPKGELLDDTTIYSFYGTTVSYVFPDDKGNMYCFGTEPATMGSYNQLYMSKLDNQLNTLWKQGFDIEQSGWTPAIFQVSQDSDTSFIIGGSVLSSLHNGFAMRVDTAGNLLNYQKYDLEGTQTLTSILKKPDNSGYVALGYGMLPYNYVPGFNLVCDWYMEIEPDLQMDTIAFHEVYMDLWITGRQFDENSYIFSGTFDSERYPTDIGLTRANFQDHQIQSNTQINLTKGNEFTAAQSLDFINTTEIYLLGSYGFAEGQNVPWGTGPTYLMLAKFDENLAPVWQKFYGDGYAYYYATSVHATPDGGALLLGTRYDYNPEEELDVYVVKVDANGEIHPPTGQENLSEARQAIVYPNPGSRELRVRVAVQLGQCHMLLYDMQGRQVLNAEIAPGENTLNTVQLPAGTYIYHIQSGNQTVESGQWTKTR